jgi:hypothetical protein
MKYWRKKIEKTYKNNRKNNRKFNPPESKDN